jgi:hypothetical protein
MTTPLNDVRLDQLSQKIAWQNGYDNARRNEVQKAIVERCSEQGHDYENCSSSTFRIYQRCKWCGEEI